MHEEVSGRVANPSVMLLSTGTIKQACQHLWENPEMFEKHRGTMALYGREIVVLYQTALVVFSPLFP